jgi:hypothetical protein
MTAAAGSAVSARRVSTRRWAGTRVIVAPGSTVAEKSSASYTCCVMQPLKAHVKDGRLVLDDPSTDLPDGTEVELYLAYLERRNHAEATRKNQRKVLERFFRFAWRGSEGKVTNVAYPPNENALVFEVYAEKACAVKVRVSYLIANLTRSFEYMALADKDETLLTLRNFLRLHNWCGEEFGPSGVWAGFGPKFHKEFGQQEDVKMLVQKFDAVPIQKTYTFDWYTHGPLNPDKPQASRVLMHYKLKNDEKNHLGAFPLQPGKVRIFIQDGHGGEAFLGEDWAQLTPLDGDMKLFLGEARDIVCTRIVESNERHNQRGNLFDQEVVIKYEIENFKDKAATIDIVEQLNRVGQEFFGNTHGDVQWENGDQTTATIRVSDELGGATPKLSVDLPARPADKDKAVEKVIVKFHFTLRNLWQ